MSEPRRARAHKDAEVAALRCRPLVSEVRRVGNGAHGTAEKHRSTEQCRPAFLCKTCMAAFLPDGYKQLSRCLYVHCTNVQTRPRAAFGISDVPDIRPCDFANSVSAQSV